MSDRCMHQKEHEVFAVDNTSAYIAFCARPQNAADQLAAIVLDDELLVQRDLDVLAARFAYD